MLDSTNSLSLDGGGTAIELFADIGIQPLQLEMTYMTFNPPSAGEIVAEWSDSTAIASEFQGPNQLRMDLRNFDSLGDQTFTVKALYFEDPNFKYFENTFTVTAKCGAEVISFPNPATTLGLTPSDFQNGVFSYNLKDFFGGLQIVSSNSTICPPKELKLCVDSSCS